MPIAAELRHLYRTEEWFAARKIVQERAKGRCEWCGKPKGDQLQALDHTGRWFDESLLAWIWPKGFATNTRYIRIGLEIPEPKRYGIVRCVLTTAHLDHTPGHDSLDNLAALCQRCHLVYDGPSHRQSARLRRDRESGQLRLELVA